MHTKSSATTHHQQQESPRASISTSSSSLVSMDSRRGSCQNSTGSHETKRTYKTGFLNPAQTAQFDFLVERFKHRKQAAKEKEGQLTAANLKALEASPS